MDIDISCLYGWPTETGFEHSMSTQLAVLASDRHETSSNVALSLKRIVCVFCFLSFFCWLVVAELFRACVAFFFVKAIGSYPKFSELCAHSNDCVCVR